ELRPRRRLAYPTWRGPSLYQQRYSCPAGLLHVEGVDVVAAVTQDEQQVAAGSQSGKSYARRGARGGLPKIGDPLAPLAREAPSVHRLIRLQQILEIEIGAGPVQASQKNPRGPFRPGSRAHVVETQRL